MVMKKIIITCLVEAGISVCVWEFAKGIGKITEKLYGSYLTRTLKKKGIEAQ